MGRPDLVGDTDRGTYGTVESFDSLMTNGEAFRRVPAMELTEFLTAAEAPFLAELWDNE